MFWYQRLACVVLVGCATAAEVSHLVIDNVQTPIMPIRQNVVQERTQKLLHMRRANRLVRAGCWVGAATVASLLTYTFCTECTFFSKDRTKLLEGRIEVVEDILREIAPAIEDKKGFFHRTYRALYDSVTGLPGIAMATTCLWRLIFQEYSLSDYMRSTTVHEAHAQVVEQLSYTINALKVAAHVYSLERIDTIYMQITQSYNKMMRDAEQLIAYMEFQLAEHGCRKNNDDKDLASIDVMVRDLIASAATMQTLAQQYALLSDAQEQKIAVIIASYEQIAMCNTTFQLLFKVFATYEEAITNGISEE